MSATTKIGNIILGEGVPKICVPVTAKSYDGIISDMKYIVDNARESVDLIELRIDFYEDVDDICQVEKLLGDIREVIDKIPLLFTFRTKEEGGEKSISNEEYEKLLTAVAKTKFADAIDVQIMTDEEVLERIIESIKSENIKVVASNHDFNKTPAKEKIKEVLFFMEKKNADVAKIAVMPQNFEDVCTLMMAAEDTKESIKIPVVAISMGKLGAVSRLAGSQFNSAMTFGTVKNSSAPGQMDAKKLKEVLKMMSTEEKSNIYLIGFMGAGKTTVSNMLTSITGRKEIDADAYIVKKEGKTINDIFAEKGETYFREIETKYLKEISEEKNMIVSCGGGAVLKDENVEIMKKTGKIVLLTATPQTTYERVKDSTDRPILNGNMNIEYIEELMNRRKDRYLAVADEKIATDEKDVEQICDEIIKRCMNIK